MTKAISKDHEINEKLSSKYLKKCTNNVQRLKTHSKIHDYFLLIIKYGSTNLVYELYLSHWIALQKAHLYYYLFNHLYCKYIS